MNTPTFATLPPAAIEAASFAMIEREFFAQTGRKVTDFPADQFKVIQRVIHATGDFSFAHTLVFHPEAIAAARAALDAGKDIWTDVGMAATGISRAHLERFGGRVVCRVADQEIARQAAATGATRSETAIRQAFAEDAGIIAIGNAPTALIAAIDQARNATAPPLIIGVPVGFVNAVESKDWLRRQDFPYITALGRKGGSPVAAAIVNALLRLLTKEDGDDT